MTRRAFKLLLFLLAGAIINVAVAWGCALAMAPSWSDTCRRGTYISRSDGVWLFAHFRRLGRCYLFTTRTDSLNESDLTIKDLAAINDAPGFIREQDVPSWSLFEEMSRADAHSQIRQVWHERAYGLPSRSLYWARDLGVEPGRYVSAIRLPVFRKMMPGRPIWAGFAINTIFYAAILWALFAAPFKVRRWRRIKRGQCASCGYSLRGTPHIEKCPECGATA